MLIADILAEWRFSRAWHLGRFAALVRNQMARPVFRTQTARSDDNPIHSNMAMMTTRILGALFFCSALAWSTSAQTNEFYPPGDVNGDFHVTGADSLLINQVMVGLRSNTHPIFAVTGFENGDVNDNGTVSGADSLVINQVMVGLRAHVTTAIFPFARTNPVPMPVTVFGIGFPTNTPPLITIGSPINVTLSNVVVVNREQITAMLPAGGGWGTGTVSVAGTITNGVTSFGKFITVPNVLSVATLNPNATEDGPQPGIFEIRRNGGTNTLTVLYTLGGTATNGVDFSPLSGSVMLPPDVTNATIAVTPMADAAVEASELVTLTLATNSGYIVDAPSSASLVIADSSTPTGTGLTGQYYDNASATYTNAANFTGLMLTQVDPTINFDWGTNAPIASMGTNTFSIRWTGQVQPEHSETYIFGTRSSDGVKLWVNGQLLIDQWQTQGTTDWTNQIPLEAGVRYDIKLEYFENTGSASVQLYWYSESQTKQPIPLERLYPTAAAPAVITSPTSAVGLVGGAFSYLVTGSNLPLGFDVNNLPPGLTFNPATGLISGTPTAAGAYQVMLTTSNALGVSYAVLNLTIQDTGGSITRDYWTGIGGTAISAIPVDSLPSGAGTLTNLASANFGDDYGARIRGYLTAPVTGNYYFWIAASDTAELWISNDHEPVNKVKRASVTSGTPPLSFTNQPNQKSPWLALVAGQRYYIEVLHKAGTGTNDNVAVGWLRPDQAGTGPSEVVPGFVLSPYVEPPPSSIPGTLYATTMLAQGAAQSQGIGTSTLRLSADESQATFSFAYTNLTSPYTAAHIHSDPYLNHPSQIIFDIDDATPEADGSYIWPIAAVGTLSAADVLEVIKQGKAFINIHTVNYPAGEIRGNYTLANGSQTFSPPPDPPAWTDDHANANAAARFLMQATFGPSQSDIAAVQAMGYEAWIDDQFARPVSHHLPFVLANLSSDPTAPYPRNLTFNSWWQQSVTAPDQLRQRVAFALSEILVVSEIGVLDNNGRALSAFYDTLLDNAFGNFREILEAVTLTPAMGLYLDMRRNEKGDLATGRIPNENYAREILQLFSVGLYRMWPDGTLVLNSQDNLVPTYDQNVVIGYSRLFTGWNYNQPNQSNGRLPTNWSPAADYINPMKLVPTRHELGTKRILDNVVMPAAAGSQADPTNAEYDNYGLQELETGLDAIFNHPNVGPFVCRQLIQRLVTSHPSRDYLYRVVKVFHDNGAGVRGDMAAVIKAILLDYEARSSSQITRSTFGKQREPLLRATGVARAFPSPQPNGGTYSQNGGRAITVTTTNAHRLATGNNIFLQFDSGTPVPTSTAYPVTVTGVNTFTVNATGVLTGAYNQAGGFISINSAGHGLAVSNRLHITFTTGGASNGVYEVVSVPSNSAFSVTTPDAATLSGNCLLAFYKGGYSQPNTNIITVSTAGNHGLNPGDQVYIDFMSGTAADGQYAVASVVDEDHFTIVVGAVANQNQNSHVVAPLAGPPLVRSGNVTVQSSTWNMGVTDLDLTQTPLRSPTVFNYFFPDYKFPGLLASAGLTTPEFQLTSDTGVALQNNFLAGAIINSQGSNTNGLNSFKNGNGSIVLDIGPYMTTNYTSNTGVPSLVGTLNSLLLAGQLSTGASNTIVTYVTSTNFPYSTPPTASQQRDRVRATIHLMVTSPDFTIQK